MINSHEIHLPKTEDALYALSADMRDGFGDHINHALSAGDVSVQLGAEAFDPNYHDIADVDPSLQESQMMDSLYVPTGLASRPLVVNIVQDQMLRSENTLFGLQKKALSDQLTDALEYAAPSTDPVTGSIITDQVVERHDFRHVAKANSRPDGVKKIEWLAVGGLAVVISDYQNMKFDSGSMQNVVAIKVNHLLERTFPAGLGPRKVGSGLVLNTDNPKDLYEYNARLQEKHEGIVDGLQQAGALVVPVVADLRIKPHTFNVAQTDLQIARAVEDSNR